MSEKHMKPSNLFDFSGLFRILAVNDGESIEDLRRPILARVRARLRQRRVWGQNAVATAFALTLLFWGGWRPSISEVIGLALLIVPTLVALEWFLVWISALPGRERGGVPRV